MASESMREKIARTFPELRDALSKMSRLTPGTPYYVAPAVAEEAGKFLGLLEAVGASPPKLWPMDDEALILTWRTTEGSRYITITEEASGMVHFQPVPAAKDGA